MENDGYSVVYELITTSTFTEEARKDIEAFQNKLAEEESPKFEAEFVAVELNDVRDNYYRAMEQDNPSINHIITLENGKYLFTAFFTEDGANKYYTLSLGKEWTGGDVMEDYC